jgi:flavodoxin
MKTLVIYDSYFGNTKLVAETVAKELGIDVKVTPVTDLDPKELTGVELLIVGSPIRGWKPSPKTEEVLKGLHNNQLQGIKAAAFDTRVKGFFHGDAVKKMIQMLKEKGAEIISEPQGFYVKGREGPMHDGELEKAIVWAKSIKTKCQN